MLTKRALSAILLMISGLSFFAAVATATENSSIPQVKSESLRFLQELRSENNKKLNEIDDNLDKEADDRDGSPFDETALKNAQQEHRMRQQFLDRLIFQIDTKFRGGDLRNFLEVSLTEMTKSDPTAPSESALTRFLSYVAEAIHALPEKKENILSFVEEYMNRSVANPVPPKEYLASRNYTDGMHSESGAGLERSEAGAYAERRLSERPNIEPAAQKRAP